MNTLVVLNRPEGSKTFFRLNKLVAISHYPSANRIGYNLEGGCWGYIYPNNEVKTTEEVFNELGEAMRDDSNLIIYCRS